MSKEKDTNTSVSAEEKEKVHITYEEPKTDLKDMVHESSAAYGTREKRQGEYTLEDYRNWPEDERVELIDGEILVMEAPTTYHQIAIGGLYIQFCNYINQKKGTCRAMLSPLDVQLDEDNKTMLQPDLIILCDPQRLKRWGIFGAPDFVLEVVSPSSRKYDMVRKKNKYIAAGVREYWILDLDKRLLIVYSAAEQYSAVIYPLEGQVGVAIFNNDLKIDFDPLAAELDRLQENG